ncbi:hypothetical protein N9P46_01575 [Gammaproteobacteria bacterium]|jgi:hypothetical protein|nr:hypothetical protein [Gammaproteobacteria bacterium]
MLNHSLPTIKEYFLIFCTGLLFISVIVFLFPSPYYLIGNFNGLSAYDGEPDYFANIISFMENGHSMDFLHPGVPINTLAGSLLTLFSKKFTVEQVILAARAMLLFFNFLFIYLGSRIVLRQSLAITCYLIGILFFFPAGFVLLDHVSPNSILYGLSVLVIALGSRIGNGSLYVQILFGFFLGLAISIKYIAFFLATPMFLSFFFAKSSDFLQTIKFMKICLFTAFIAITTFLMFSWSIVPFLPFAITLHEIDLSVMSLVLQKPVFLILCASIFFLTIISIRSITTKYLNFQFDSLYYLICLCMLMLFMTIALINLITADSFLLYAFNHRNFLLILGFIVLFIPLIEKLKFFTKNFKYLFLVAFVLLGVKSNFNFLLSERALSEEILFNELINEQHQTDFLIFYPPFSFASKDLFVAWADYRYGDQQVRFDSQNAPFILNASAKRFNILNAKKFNLLTHENKIAYNYFKFLSNSRYVTESQKTLALNQMNLLKRKKMCTELYDGFLPTDDFTIIIPDSLSSYLSTAKVLNLGSGYKYAHELANKINVDCSWGVKITTKNFGSQTMYFLKKL